MADPALANNTINKTQYRYFFYLGIPSGMKVWVEEYLPKENRKKMSPPVIQQVMDILISHFDKDCLSFEPWIEPSEPTVISIQETSDSQLM
jgi:hypothetical protein